ncbi:MAG TPA: serine protein kinase RIO [Candidatus Thermoplasmatota archaeon]|jgi:RIO kinase 1|nr:serine protein kinase RIO [Candidatus Thermoplasmatota archaeon]
MAQKELREDWMDFVESRLGEDLTPKGRPRKDKLAQEFGRKTEGEVFDRPTMLTLYRLISRNLLKTLDYPVSTGKEANVFHATDPNGHSLAVKIFRVHTATFHHYLQYIQGDPRFESLKGDRRNIIHAWVRKEYKNLLRLHDAGVRVPRPVAWAENVLVMAFVGGEGTSAPLLKDVELANPGVAFEDIAAAMERMWNRAGLVHGDLSEYNIMVADEELVIIDVGQAVMQKHPMAREFLERDTRNVARYFRKLGVATDAATLQERVQKGAEAQAAARSGHPETKFEVEDPRQRSNLDLDEELDQ